MTASFVNNLKHSQGVVIFTGIYLSYVEFYVPADTHALLFVYIHIM